MNSLIIDDDQEDIDYFVEVVRGIDDKIQCLTINSGDEAIRRLGELTEPLSIFFLMVCSMEWEAKTAWPGLNRTKACQGQSHHLFRIFDAGDRN